MASKQGSSTENEHWEVFAFDGADTLCLARFVQHIVKKVSIYKQCVVFVEGKFRKSEEEAKIVARPLGGKVDGYVRNITVKEIPSTKNWRVGCRGATLEEIKADTVSFFFFGLGKELHAKLANSPFEFYLRKEKEGLTGDKFDFLIENMQVHSAIAVAKKRKDTEELNKLLPFLKEDLRIQRQYGLDASEMVADGFRVVATACASDANTAKRATNTLIHYVESSLQHSPLSNAIIYAIESLGCVAKGCDETRYTLVQFLEKVLSNVSKRKKKGRTAGDIVWASLVALKGKGNLEFDERILNDPAIKSIIKQHRFKDILQTVLKEVTKGEFALPEPSDIHSPAPDLPEEQKADLKQPHSYFLSYSRTDEQDVDHIEVILRRQKRDVKRDENDIKPGATLGASIEEMINRSDTFIVFWSKAYHDSGWCRSELDYAIQRQGNSQKPSRIVLLALDGTDPPLGLSGHLFLNGKSRKDRELGVQRVMASA